MRVPWPSRAVGCLAALLVVVRPSIAVPVSSPLNNITVPVLNGSFSRENHSSHDVSVGDPDRRDGSSFIGDPVTLQPTLGAGALPDWLKSSPVLGALTPAAVNRTKGDLRVDGVVVRIAPRYVVTSTSLLSEHGLAQLRNASFAYPSVVFQGGAVPVTRVVFESDFYGADMYPLVVLELRDEPRDSPLARLVTSKPLLGFEYEQLRMVHVANLLLNTKTNTSANRSKPTQESKLTFFAESLCGFSASPVESDTSITEMCVGRLTKPTEKSDAVTASSSRHRDLAQTHNFTHKGPSSPTIPRPRPHDKKSTSGPPLGFQGAPRAEPSFLFYGDDLLGLSIPVSTTAGKSSPKSIPDKSSQKHGFLRLAGTDHRAFLDAATSQTMRSNDDDVFSRLSKYPSYLATFLDMSGQKTPCQGVLIAPQFVLTTASCLQAHSEIATVQFFGSHNSTQRESVKVTRTAAHPRYSTGDVTFDTAVIALERAVALAPIHLDDGSVNETASLARIQVTDDPDQCFISGTAPIFASGPGEDDHCRAANGQKLRPSEAFCMRPIAAADGFSVASFLGDDSIASVDVARASTITGAALVTVTRHSRVALVGLAVLSSPSRDRRLDLQASGNTGNSNGEVYVRVANSATFINSHVDGTSWCSSGTTSVNKVEALDYVELPQDKQFVVGLRATRDGQNYCGGSLIAPTIVLTAAHCVVDGTVQFVSVGAYNSAGSDAEVIAVLPNRTRTHAQYGKPHQFSFDVAILELAFASAAAPVLLDYTVDYTNRESATMYGYGMSSASSGLSPTLRAVEMPLWSRSACRQAFGDEVDDSMLCAGGEQGKDACAGDSGSPLVITRGGKSVLVGVVSAGAGCGLANVPGVYARIQRVRDFLLALVIGAKWSTGEATDGGGSNNSMGSSPGSAGSSTQDPTSLIEAREASTSAPPPQTPSWTNTTTTTPAPGPYKMAKLPLSSLSPLVRQSLMNFLLGSDTAQQIVGATVFDSMKDVDNILQLYSTVELSDLLAVVSRHNQLPLNRRRDRFNRWKDAYASAPSNGCTAV